jgi:2'-5' RNA ligase
MVGRLNRLFVAVEVPDESRHLLAAAMKDRLSVPAGMVPPRNWHVTIRFLGPTDDVTRDRLLAEIDGADLGPPFRIRLNGLGTFPAPRRATVLWAGVDRGGLRLEGLAATVEGIAQALGYPPEDRPYRPHLTLARLRPALDLRPVLSDVTLPPIEFMVEALSLFASSLGGGPARYEVLERFPLD